MLRHAQHFQIVQFYTFHALDGKDVIHVNFGLSEGLVLQLHVKVGVDASGPEFADQLRLLQLSPLLRFLQLCAYLTVELRQAAVQHFVEQTVVEQKVEESEVFEEMGVAFAGVEALAHEGDETLEAV